MAIRGMRGTARTNTNVVRGNRKERPALRTERVDGTVGAVDFMGPNGVSAVVPDYTIAR